MVVVLPTMPLPQRNFHHVDFAQRDLQLGFFVVEEECTCVYGHRGWW